jgi:DNA-binding MarR family transcriptional regulator
MDTRESPEHEAYLNIARTYGALTAHFDRLFRRHGLTTAQYRILGILASRQDVGLSLREIADRMTTPVPDMTRLVDRLERAGLARRQRSAKDRRVIRVTVTQQGLATLNAVEPQARVLERELLGHLASGEVALINRLMTKVRRADSEE